MSTVGFGPLLAVDGPPPLAPLYGLLPAANSPAAGVRIVDDVDSRGIERWLNGIEVYPYPIGTGDVFDGCAPGTIVQEKSDGTDEGIDLDNPQFKAWTAYLPVSCKSYKVWDQAEYKARALAVFSAVESALVASEFMRGTRVPDNAHLADGGGTFPNGDAATSPLNALALLEGEIADSGRQGIIHVSPTMMPHITLGNIVVDRNGVLRTLNGTVILPDPGYAGGSHPTGHANSTGTKEWMYATGPVDVRRSTDVFVMPETAAEALDRGHGVDGATRGHDNLLTYRVERYYLIAWDTAVQSAVYVDRCQTTC